MHVAAQTFAAQLLLLQEEENLVPLPREGENQYGGVEDGNTADIRQADM